MEGKGKMAVDTAKGMSKKGPCHKGKMAVNNTKGLGKKGSV